MATPTLDKREKAKVHRPLPAPTAEAGRRALAAIISQRSVLPALSVFHEELGDVFQISLGAFRPVFMVGPEAARFVLVTGKDHFLWRPPDDPVTRLLRNGLLMTDGDKHDTLRRVMNPSLHRRRLDGYTETMSRNTDRVLLDWSIATGPVDMLVEMRRIALLLVMETLFSVDMLPDLDRLFPVVVEAIRYISPGLWTVWPKAPRPGYRRSLQEMDAWLYKLIAERRCGAHAGEDLLSTMIANPAMDDDLIRDQMLTLLIAGHDTSTALLAWTLLMLGQHADVAERVVAEVDKFVGAEIPTLKSVSHLSYLDQVLNETLRLYPPIHIGNRIAAVDLDYEGYHIPKDTRVVYSIYLTHRHSAYWQDPHRFDPERFSADSKKDIPPYAYLPFGGGARNCIGAAFAQAEAKVVLSRILQRFDLTLDRGHVRPHMGATLEPHPGVRMHVRERRT